jgi:hypothetical protein
MYGRASSGLVLWSAVRWCAPGPQMTTAARRCATAARTPSAARRRR